MWTFSCISLPAVFCSCISFIFLHEQLHSDCLARGGHKVRPRRRCDCDVQGWSSGKGHARCEHAAALGPDRWGERKQQYYVIPALTHLVLHPHSWGKTNTWNVAWGRSWSTFLETRLVGISVVIFGLPLCTGQTTWKCGARL